MTISLQIFLDIHNYVLCNYCVCNLSKLKFDSLISTFEYLDNKFQVSLCEQLTTTNICMDF